MTAAPTSIALPQEAGAAPAQTAALVAVLDGMPFPCAAFDEASGALWAANRAYLDAFSPLPEHAHREHLLERLQQDGSSGGEVKLPHDGRWYALHWGHAVADGRPLSLLTAVDVSARLQALDSRKHQQDKLLFTSRMMSVGEMAATLAHELNQPLAAIVNYLNGSLRLMEQAGGPGQVERALVAARAQAEHASAVIGRVREFVRAREPRRDAQDLASIAQVVTGLLQLEAERMQLRIEIALPPGLPLVHADRVMIEQVLLNLVKNAIEAMRDTPAPERALRIEGRTGLEGDVEVRVRDRGPGLDPVQQEKLFTAFFTTKADGLGIGLSICRSIIEYHEGRLFYEPPDDGRGSIFGFTLPPAPGRS